MYRYDHRAAAQHANAPNSINATPWKTKSRIQGVGSFTCEPPDGDDSFPPAIASYEVVDGWLVYHGRNGSWGVLAGSPQALSSWTHEVDKALKQYPLTRARPWVPADGGEQHVEQAVEAANAMLRKGQARADIRVVVEPGNHPSEATGNTIWLTNVHHGGSIQMLGGISLPVGAKTGAHEAAHLVFARQPSKAQRVIAVLVAREKQGQDYVSTYHALAGHLEGTMDAAALYLLAGPRLKRVAPDVYEACREWLD